MNKSFHYLVPSVAPLNLTAIPGPYPGSMANLTWNAIPAIYQNGIVTGYRIRYAIYSYKDQTEEGVTYEYADNKTEHALIYLLPARNYSIRVAAVNLVGTGNYSNMILHHTSDGGKVRSLHR